MPPLTDHELLAQIARHDRAAFGALYDRFAPRLFGLVVKLLESRSEAEDVLQEVFLQVWRSARRYDPQLSQPIVWLMLIARGRSIDAIRRRASQSGLQARAAEGWAPDIEQSPTRMLDPNEESPCVSKAVAGLPAEQSDAIGLAFHGGLTCAEIAALRDLPIGTVKTRIRLGMIKLREALNSGARTLNSSEVVT